MRECDSTSSNLEQIIIFLPSRKKIVDIGFLFDSRKMCDIVQAKCSLRAEHYGLLFGVFFGRPAQIEKTMQISK